MTVADGSSSTPGPFDVATIKTLVALMSRHEISEIDLRQGDQRIRLLRGSSMPLLAVPPPAEMSGLPPTIAPTASEPPPAPAADMPRSRPLYEIKSPTPGTFYAASSPEVEPYVKVGSRVTPETIVCLIEAMKLFTEITADISGVVAEILVQNQQPVEYGQVLFRVDTGG
jgi:acetyl-CoA carboxylase biotin carboxyl carrier protein